MTSQGPPNREDARRPKGGLPDYTDVTADATGAPKPPPPAPPPLQIDGYHIVREISEGGQAVVYRGVQESTGRRVAIKVLLHGPFAREWDKARFEREVQILAALEHPSIVHVIDRGVTAGGQSYVVMEYVEGVSLDEHLDEWHRRSGPIPEDPSELLRLFMEICDAVNAAHLRGVVHRDLKPSNIRVDTDGRPRILDFGLARAALEARAGEERHPVTVTGQFLGSLPYASPEQAEGVPSMIDARTDVYALGVILYRMLTNQFPYEVVGNIRDVLDNIMRAEPTPPSTVIEARLARQANRQRRWRSKHRNPINPVIEAIVLKALAKKREDRYESAGELSRDIANYLSGKPTIAAGALAQRRWPKVAIRIGGAFLCLAAAGVVVWHLTHRPGPSGPPEIRQTDRPGRPPARSWQVYTQWPFDAAEAKRRQAETASAIGAKVEEQIDLGGGATMKLVLIPAGQFVMGSPDTDRTAQSDEKPQRRVTIGHPFSMGVTEVTRGQFAAFVADSGYRTEAEKEGLTRGWDAAKRTRSMEGASWRNAGLEQTKDHPVVHVSWNDATAFCRWLSRKTGRKVTLATEAQWEYACRAGAPTRFSFGHDDGELYRYGNYADRSHTPRHEDAWRDKAHDDGHDRTAPAGSYKPNAWGLHDMHGNVWEWCSDWYADSYTGAETLDPQGPKSGTYRTVRSGAWGRASRFCRSAARLRPEPHFRSFNVGFRVALAHAGTGEGKPAEGPPGKAGRPATGRSETAARIHEGWPFDAAEAKRRQYETARSLNVPVEDGLDLGKGVTLKLALIPAGQFVMGSPDSVRAARPDEKPQRKVTLTRPFYMGIHEVTQAQYEAVMGTNPSQFKGKDRPVETVFWGEAAEFCRQASRRTGRRVMLPTEAQWEVACRAGTASAYSFGDEDKDLHKYANYADRSFVPLPKCLRDPTYDDGHDKTAPVGSYKPNPWGLYDMYGNVWEWCADWLDRQYYAAEGNRVDPTGPESGKARVMRGGCWLRPPMFCRSANREGGWLTYRVPQIGFRVVVAVGSGN